MDSIKSSLTEIYNRQSDLEDFSDSSAMVIGVGGVGSWVALDLALIGMGTILLIDNDKLEGSNLNRTLFKIDQVGKYKTLAMKELIYERRPDTLVLTIEDKFQTQFLDKYNVEYIFDCTDNLATRKLIEEYKQRLETNFEAMYCKCGYDGFQATLSINDFESGRWGDEGSYTAVPSFFGTPQILSAVAVIEMLLIEDDLAYSENFNVKKIINKIKEPR